MSNLNEYLSELERFKEETSKNITVVASKKTALLDEMLEIYSGWLKYPGFEPDEILYDPVSAIMFRSALEYLRDLKVDSESITLFFLKLEEYKDRALFSRSGLFISALMEKSSDEEFEIITVGHEMIDYLGYRNQKKIRIMGNTGWFTGKEMTKGELIIKGTAGQLTGEKMTGGTIIADRIESISEQWKRGEIYENGKRVRPI